MTESCCSYRNTTFSMLPDLNIVRTMQLLGFCKEKNLLARDEVLAADLGLGVKLHPVSLSIRSLIFPHVMLLYPF